MIFILLNLDSKTMKKATSRFLINFVQSITYLFHSINGELHYNCQKLEMPDIFYIAGNIFVKYLVCPLRFMLSFSSCYLSHVAPQDYHHPGKKIHSLYLLQS